MAFLAWLVSVTSDSRVSNRSVNLSSVEELEDGLGAGEETFVPYRGCKTVAVFLADGVAASRPRIEWAPVHSP